MTGVIFVDDTDIIELHFMYFNQNDNIISNAETSLNNTKNN